MAMVRMPARNVNQSKGSTMTSTRDAFLQRVRQAVAQGNRAGSASDLPDAAPSAIRARGSIRSPIFVRL